MKRLWGDSFFNVKKKIWTKMQTPEVATGSLPCAFCQFIMTSINQLVHAVMNDETAKHEKMMTTLCIDLKGNERALHESR